MADLTDLASVKTTWLKISTTTDDAILSALITAASAQIENYLQRSIGVEGEVTENRNGSGTPMMVLKKWPLTDLSEVLINGVSIPASVNGSYGWITNPWDEETLPIPPATVQLVGALGYGAPGIFLRGAMNVTFNYTAGFETVPAAIKTACNMLVGALYREKDAIRQKSVTLGTQTTAYEMDMPVSCKNLLAPYRSVAPLAP